MRWLHQSSGQGLRLPWSLAAVAEGVRSLAACLHMLPHPPTHPPTHPPPQSKAAKAKRMAGREVRGGSDGMVDSPTTVADSKTPWGERQRRQQVGVSGVGVGMGVAVCD